LPSDDPKRTPIPLFRPLISSEAIEAVAEVLRSGWLGTGPKTAAFEAALAAHFDIPYCVAVDSGTAALQLSLALLDLAPEAEVITTPITFVSTNHAILHAGLRPVFADVELATGNLDVGSVRDRVSDRTGAIMLVHYGGYPCDLDAFYRLGRERGIPIVEDCAHACGSRYRGRFIGSTGDYHAFSFQAVKNLATGDGGAVLVRRQEHDSRLRRLRWFGIDADTHKRVAPGGYDWRYNVTETGFKCAMNDIQAAIGLAQLPRLEGENRRRASIAARYREQLAGVAGLDLLQYAGDRESNYHLFCLRAERRDDLIRKLKENGISAGVHYERNDRFPMYQLQDLPAAERFWRSAVSLPMHLMLTDDDVDWIGSIIREGW
jgi:perosamine synthetase